MNNTDIILYNKSNIKENRKCLKSLRENTSNYRLVYVNHTNFDDYTKSHPEIIPIFHPYDCFSDCFDDYNLALKYMFEIRHTDSDYIVLMEDNIILPDNWLNCMQNIFRKDHTIMAVIPLSDYLLEHFPRKYYFPMLRLPHNFEDETFKEKSGFLNENYGSLYSYTALPNIGCIVLSRDGLKKMEILDESDKIINRIDSSRYNMIQKAISLGTYIKIQGAEYDNGLYCR